MKPFENEHRTITLAKGLGYAGLMPFVVSVLVLVIRDDGPLTRHVFDGLAAYGAIILSFMGAVHWGRALFMSPDNPLRLTAFVVSVCPAILAWVALLMPTVARLVLLIVGFCTLYCYDVYALNSDQALKWYLQLRLRLTATVVACLIVALVLFI